SHPPGTIAPVKILHTSDWHVGRTIRGRDRAHEHRAVLSEIAGVARAEAVELVVVAGDLFDSAAPTAEAERIVYRSLLDLAEVGPVVVVAGNHDHPRRLQAVAPLLELGRVTVGSHLRIPEEGGVVRVATDGGEAARVALVPFLSQRYIVSADDLMHLDADDHGGAYEERMRLILERLCAAMGPEEVNLVVGHLTAAGARTGGGERQAHIFGYTVSPASFPGSLHYAALGHLHRCQQVPANCPAWYSGSPLQLDFGEVEDRKGVLVVEAAPGHPAEVREVPLTCGRRLRTLRGTLEEVAALSDITDDAYLKVVLDEPGRVGLADRVRELFPQAVDVVLAAPPDPDRAEASPVRLGRPPRELFDEYLRHGRAHDDRLIELFDRLLEEAHAPDQA
ncbi:MAG: metallophosphoesterase family protein, partial [Acidimicrobiia bacterium]